MRGNSIRFTTKAKYGSGLINITNEFGEKMIYGKLFALFHERQNISL